MGARERSGRKAQIQKLRQFEEIRSTFFFGGMLGFRRAFLPAPPRAKIRAFSETPFSERRARRPQKIAFCRRRVSILWRDIDKAYVLLGAINREPDGPIKNG